MSEDQGHQPVGENLPTKPPTSPPSQWSGAITDKKTPNDPINPNHYKGTSGQEVADVIEDFGLEDKHYLAAALAYILRAGKKPDTPIHQDIEKAIWYLKRFNVRHTDERDT